VRAPDQVATDGYRSLNENQRVSLTVVKGAKGAQATNIRPIWPAAFVADVIGRGSVSVIAPVSAPELDGDVDATATISAAQRATRCGQCADRGGLCRPFPRDAVLAPALTSLPISHRIRNCRRHL